MLVDGVNRIFVKTSWPERYREPLKKHLILKYNGQRCFVSRILTEGVVLDVIDKEVLEILNDLNERWKLLKDPKTFLCFGCHKIVSKHGRKLAYYSVLKPAEWHCSSCISKGRAYEYSPKWARTRRKA